MITKWQSIKSWWYWKVSSKYDATDMFVFIVYPALIVLIGVQLFEQKQKADVYAQECLKKGGVPLETNHKYICVDPKAFK